VARVEYRKEPELKVLELGDGGHINVTRAAGSGEGQKVRVVQWAVKSAGSQ
jgi:hypothetical protein